MSKNQSYSINYVLVLMMVVLAALPARAFAPDTYAGRSVLASGRWVKVQVTSTGLHEITASMLRQWGFGNPDNVRIYGYGGADIPDVMSPGNYIDDLPQVQTAVTDRGVVFYAVGPVSWPSGSGAHAVNQYSTAGYYFVTECDTVPRRTVDVMEPVGASQEAPQETYVCSLLHESDQVSPGKTGCLLLGEDFVYTRSRTFNFTLTDYTGDDVRMRCAFFAKAMDSSLSFAVNGNTLPMVSADYIYVSESQFKDSKYYGRSAAVEKNFRIDGTRLALDVTYNVQSTPERANLDYIEIHYPRRIALHGGMLAFTADSEAVALDGSNETVTVWDVTDPLDIKGMTVSTAESRSTWVNQRAGRRDYAAWVSGATLPSPVLSGRVANQDLHGMGPADMVIVAPAAFMEQAERLAGLHRNSADSLTVHVVNQEQAFNEFGSGMAHPNALRRMLKMFYDRGGDVKLRYALMLGRGSYDNRRLTPVVRRRSNMMPLWQSVASDHENTSFTTDDVYGFLEDGSGSKIESDRLSIAVGRIPAATVGDAAIAVTKIDEYMHSMPRKSWKNRMVFMADDADEAVHMIQTDSLLAKLQAQNAGNRFIYDKVYIDAYERIDGGYPSARKEFFRALNEGVLMWTYVGHGNPSSLTGDKMVMPTDISGLYLRQYPMLYAATCEFLRWDGDDYCGAEIMHFTADGGTIASVSSTRLAWISDNGKLTDAFGSMFTRMADDGRFMPIGEIYRQAKNSIGSNENKLRYVLMGDPALRPAAPEAEAVLTRINGVPLESADQPTLMANQNVTMNGCILNPFTGEKISGFNGVMSLDIYDADRSVTSNGHVDDPKESSVRYTFDMRGQLLYSGTARVIDGEFELSLAMPSQIAENFRPATVRMYAYSTESSLEASGTNHDIYVYGYDDSVTDTESPEITLMALNNEAFRSGGNVNSTPVLLANVSDDRGVNLSMAGVGHQMSITVDGTKTYTDVSTYYTPDVSMSGNPGGSISYQLDELSPGYHTARLRVWDTSGNMAERTLEFNVIPDLAPSILEIYTNANPASRELKFYVRHDRPDARMTVSVTVYNLLGQAVWSSEATGRSDMFVSSPLTWNLTDGSGSRVQRGIYVYRATITTEDGESATASRKLAVAAE